MVREELTHDLLPPFLRYFFLEPKQTCEMPVVFYFLIFYVLALNIVHDACTACGGYGNLLHLISSEPRIEIQR